MSESAAETLGGFDEQWWRDLDAGVERGLEEYLQMFPGDPMRVAAEWLALERGERERDSIGPYRVIQWNIGVGGQGSVHLAEDSRVPGKQVAIKVLRGEAVSSAEALRRLRQEAEITSKLQHPGICPVYAADFHGSQAYIVMPFVAGTTLTHCIQSSRWTPATEGVVEDETEVIDLESTSEGAPDTGGGLPGVGTAPGRGATSREEVQQILHLVERAARALHAAHEKGIVHRDVKPGNIMVGRDGQPIIMDFGLARDLDAQTRTLEGELLGTPLYMAPEQLAHSRIKIDRRADVWALGVTLYECLTGQRPFESPTKDGLYQAIMTKEPEDPRRLNSLVSADLAVVLATALEKDRDRRYQTALDLAEDLRCVRELKPISARAASAWTKLKRWAQRNPALAGSVSAGFLAVTGGLIVALLLLGQRDRAIETKNAALAQYDQMSDVALVEDLIAEAELLWPRRPRMIAPMKSWIGRAEEVYARLPQHQAALRSLRARAADYDATQQTADAARRRELHAELFDAIAASRESIAAKENTISRLNDRLASLEKKRRTEVRESRLRRYAARRKKAASELATAQRELAELQGALKAQESDPRLAQRLTWKLSDPAESWRHEVLSQMVPELSDLGEALLPVVKERLASAETIVERTVGEHTAAWQRCLSALRTLPKYAGSPGLERFEPQVGLVPLGIDRDSGLWEFWHVDSGRRPGWEGTAWAGDSEADPRGKVELAPDGSSGIVMVLIPGGTFLMGATRADREPNHDPEAKAGEQPVHEVTLDAFFLAKHEMTQAQWLRVMGQNPSQFYVGTTNLDGRVTGLHPVTNVSWNDAVRTLQRLDLVLPTEARWERACRAGTSSVYWCGDEVASIQTAKAGNVSDRTTKMTPWKRTPELDDGHVYHAPVGHFAPNAFGLHDTLGNVWEWCADRAADYERPTAPGDGLRDAPHSRRRVSRGGSYMEPASGTRSASRYGSAPTLQFGTMGLRPARGIQ